MALATQTLRPRCLASPRAANDNMARSPYAPPSFDGDRVDLVFRLTFWSRGRERFRAMLIARGLL
ncbi:MAG: hypothetical protein J7521_21045 [Caulobacter sp.]|nr:hypothetical protein [Caulobacter sp.]